MERVVCYILLNKESVRKISARKSEIDPGRVGIKSKSVKWFNVFQEFVKRKLKTFLVNN